MVGDVGRGEVGAEHVVVVAHVLGVGGGLARLALRHGLGAVDVHEAADAGIDRVAVELVAAKVVLRLPFEQRRFPLQVARLQAAPLTQPQHGQRMAAAALQHLDGECAPPAHAANERLALGLHQRVAGHDAAARDVQIAAMLALQMTCAQRLVVKKNALEVVDV